MEHAFRDLAPKTIGEKMSPSSKSYDIFINHRGPDVKETLAKDLYYSLREENIEVFLDSRELVYGEPFPSYLTNAITSASVQIAIFSKRYAESAWCLAELVLMLTTKAKLIPVFFDVEPCELRLKKNGLYAAAFTKHQERYPEKLIKDWKEALNSASFIPGFKNDYMLYTRIMSAVSEELDRRKDLYVAKYPVGLNKIVEDFEIIRNGEQRSKGNIEMVGIWGMRGCGKTTLAKELFNRKRSMYDRSCFLSAVAEHDMRLLHHQLLRDLCLFRHPIETVHDGRTVLWHRLQYNKKLRFFIVIDDIDSEEQIDDILFRDVLNCGGLVIVTTRDKGLLTSAGITVCYELKQLDSEHSTELFCYHAFGQPNPRQEFELLVDKFVSAAEGLPLVDLVHLGKKVSNRTDHKFWESILDEDGRGLQEKFERTLKRSFDRLTDNQKEIFMDTACFFIDKPKSIAMRIWEMSGWKPDYAFTRLNETCLVDVIENHGEEFDEENLAFRMNYHHLVLGRKRAKVSTSPHDRKWHSQDHKELESKGFQEIVTKADAHRYRFLHTFDFSRHSQITCFVGACDDSTTTNALIWLKLYLNGQNQTSIPPQIPLQNVQCLRIVNGALKRLWYKDGQAPLKLKELLLHEVELGEFTKSLAKLEYLEKLVLRGRYNDDGKEKISALWLSTSLRQLRKLKTLVFGRFGLKGAVTFSNSTSESPMKSLENIEIREEHDVRKVSITGSRCPVIRSLHLESMKELDTVTLSCLMTLKLLELRLCPKLEKLSATSTDLPRLEILYLRQCPEVIWDFSFAGLSCLKRLAIDGCKKLQDLTGIELLQGLERLQLSILGLRGVPNLVRKLQRLPSEITTLIGTAPDEADSILTDKQFPHLIRVDASNINFNAHQMFDASPESSSPVILCAVVHTEREEIIRISLSPSDVIESCIAAGKWMIIFVVTAKYNRISFGEAKIQKGCVITVNNGCPLNILKRIVEQLYNAFRCGGCCQTGDFLEDCELSKGKIKPARWKDFLLDHLTIDPHIDPVEETFSPSHVDTPAMEGLPNTTQKKPQDYPSHGVVSAKNCVLMPIFEGHIPIKTLEVVLPILAEEGNEK